MYLKHQKNDKIIYKIYNLDLCEISLFKCKLQISCICLREEKIAFLNCSVDVSLHENFDSIPNVMVFGAIMSNFIVRQLVRQKIMHSHS